MKQTKVLYILHQTILMGGGTKSFLIMLKGLMEKGIQPIVAMPNRDGVYATIETMQIPTIVVPYFDHTYPWVHSAKDVILFIPRIVRHRTMNWIAVRKIAKAVSGMGVSLVHTNVSVCAVGYVVSRKLGVPHIYHIREYADLDHGLHFFPTRRSYLRQLAAPCSYNICITKDIQRHFQQTGHAASRVIYNGIQAAVHVMPTSPKEHFFLYAGRVIASKGVMEMTEAYHAYLKQAQVPIPLYIIGEQPDKVFYERLTAYLHQHHIEQYVKFFGQRSDIQDFMARALAIIIPSPKEGFGRCMPEAMFCGCLAIGHNTGGTREQLDNGLELTGGEIALRYDTNEQLTHLLHEVGTRPTNDYTSYVQRAFYAVNQLYTTESNVEGVYDFYRQIIHQ